MLALEAAGMGVWECELKTRKVYVSEQIVSLFGIPGFNGTIDDLLGHAHPDDRDRIRACLEETICNLSQCQVEYRIIRPDGTVRWIAGSGKVTASRAGKPVRITGTMRDITPRKQLENEREEWKTRQELIFSSANLITYDYNPISGNIIWDGSTVQVMGYTIPEMGGFEWCVEHIHPEDRQNALDMLEKAKRELKPYDVFYRFRMKDGKYCYLQDRGFFMVGNTGKINRMLGVISDITSSKKALDLLNQSEQSYRELFDTVGEAIYIQDANGTFIDVNKGACRMYGYEKEEMIGKTPAFLSAENKNDPQALARMIAAALRGEPQTFEWWGKKKDGTEILKEVKLTKGTYFGKEIVIATARDITERMRAQTALRESEQRFRTLQQASFGGIGMHDHGLILDCNQGLSDITGYRYEELVGMDGLKLIAPEWRDFVMEKIKTGYDKTYDVVGLRKDGSRYFLEIRGKNIPYEGREIRVTEFRDITDRKRAEEQIVQQNTQLRSLMEDLRRKNSQLEEFTQIVSHNLRSPVGNILTLIDFYENTCIPEEREEYFNLIKESSQAIFSMLNDLNEVLKIKQEKNIEQQELHFEQVFAKVKTLIHARADELEAEIGCDFSVPSITYPRIYLESILLNLLSNALRYHAPERKPVIRLRTFRDQAGNVVLEVADNGLGINLDKYGHQIFKLRKTFHRHADSKGVGLFMIKNQIEAMGGEITVKSRENVGSTFFVNFNKP